MQKKCTALLSSFSNGDDPSPAPIYEDRNFMPRVFGIALGRVVTIAVVALIAFTACLTSAVAHAAPFTLPGTGSSLSGGSADGPPGSDGAPGINFDRIHNVDDITFKQGFVNPTVQSKFLSGKCLEQGRDTFFETEASDPFESCFYRDSEANYDYVVTDSDNRVSVARVIFVKKPVLPVLMGACIMGAATCEVSDTAVRREPLIVLGPPLHYTATSDGGPYYCTAEGYTCNSPAGAKSYKVTWAATFESSSHVEKRVNAGSFKCEQQFFGATDPAPGTLKACYLSEIQYS